MILRAGVVIRCSTRLCATARQRLPQTPAAPHDVGTVVWTRRATSFGAPSRGRQRGYALLSSAVREGPPSPAYASQAGVFNVEEATGQHKQTSTTSLPYWHLHQPSRRILLHSVQRAGPFLVSVCRTKNSPPTNEWAATLSRLSVLER